jgi:hypothetical protein
MRIVWLTAVLLGGVALGVLLSFGGVDSRAQQIPPPNQPQSAALLSLQLRGAQRSLNDTVKGVLLERDPPKEWGLLIIGAKGKGQFTCELKSADKQMLFDLQRAILFSREVTVNCANGTPSVRGGVLIDLDDPKGGSFVLGAHR